MEIGSKEQLEFIRKYTLLSLCIIQMFAIVYLYKHGNDQYESRIKTEQEKVQILQDAVKDYRNNLLLSDQLNKASSTLSSKKLNE